MASSTQDNLTMLTDLYELTMAQGYWASGKEQAQACFYIHFRNQPFQGGYAVACGMAQIAEIVRDFHIGSDDVTYLASLEAPGGGALFDPGFLAYLQDMQLGVDIDAVPEGTLVFPGEPLLQVSGPIIQCQILETALLNCINFQTLIATKAARICREAAPGAVAEFGLRRAQGPNGGNLAARAAVIGGCSSTSNVMAGRIFDIPVSGTHAHSWVMGFDSELEAFRAYAQAFPTNCTLLVDTYDVMQGVRNAITVGHEMEARGQRLGGIRIDSGDLAWESTQARSMLDAEGLGYVKIVASNDLDEYTIASLKDQEAPIDAWGVGTKLVTAYDQPALGGVYKLSAYRDSPQDEWQPRLKVSGQRNKQTLPGRLALRRYVDAQGRLAGDMVYNPDQEPSDHVIVDPKDNLRRKDLGHCVFQDLLVPLVRAGEVLLEDEPVMEVRARVQDNLEHLDSSQKRLMNPHSYPVGLSRELNRRRNALVAQARGIEASEAGVE